MQRGREHVVVIQKTKKKGWGEFTLPALRDMLLSPAAGIFAGQKKIPKGSFIGIYAGEILTDRIGEHRGM